MSTVSKRFSPLIWFRKNATLILFLFFTVIFMVKMIVFLHSHFGISRDAYYYATQLRYLRINGKLFTPDSPVLFYLLLGLDLITRDSILTLKIGTALISSSFVFPLFSLGKRLFGEKGQWSLPILAVISTVFNYINIEFLKNALGILIFILILLWSWDFMCMLRKKINRQQFLWSVIQGFVLFLLIFFTHKAAAGIAILFLLIFFSTYFLSTRRRWFAVAFPLLIMIGVGIASLFSPRILHWADFSRIQGVFQSRPFFLPWVFYRDYPRGLMSALELLICSISPLVLLFTRHKLKKQTTRLMWFLLIFFVVTMNPFMRLSGYDLTFRLFILVFFPALFFLGAGISRLNYKIRIATYIILVPLGITLVTRHSISYSNQSERIFSRYEKIVRYLNLPQPSLLICHQGFDYYYWYKEKGKAFHFLSEEQHKNIPVYRLVYGLKKETVGKYTPEFSRDVLWYHPPYLLMMETNYQVMLQKMPVEVVKKLKTWRNPYSHRPEYMLRKKKYKRWNS